MNTKPIPREPDIDHIRHELGNILSLNQCALSELRMKAVTAEQTMEDSIQKLKTLVSYIDRHFGGKDLI